jgi:hypothetical protein
MTPANLFRETVPKVGKESCQIADKEMNLDEQLQRLTSPTVIANDLLPHGDLDKYSYTCLEKTLLRLFLTSSSINFYLDDFRVASLRYLLFLTS